MTATATTATTRRSAQAAPKAAPIVITAAKGGDQTVAPRKGAIKAAIEATGKSIMAISREFGLNPSQMRRLALDQVAKVDLVRAQAIAQALGKELADLFGEPADKAKAATSKNGTPAPAPAAPKASGTRKSRAAR